MRRLLLGLIVIAAGSPAFAEDPKGPNPEGEYGGVQPGQGKAPEGSKRHKKPPPKGTLSWIGFETKSGGADVFLQSAAPFEVSQRVDKGTLIVNLSGVRKLGTNTWRPIDTRFFDTAISRITAKKKGKGVEVRIAFKNAKDATQGSMRTATEADGLYYVYLAFSGSGTPATPAAKTEPEK